MAIKEFCIKVECSDLELTRRVNDGWTIQFMQFMDSGKLHVVFVREAAQTPAPAAPQVTVVPEQKPTPIANQRLPANTSIIGLNEPVRSVPRTHNTFKRGDTRPVRVPVGDAVMQSAQERAKTTYERVTSEGYAAMKQASRSFNPNP